MLAAIPIREPALSAIVGAGATCEQIKAEWLQVKSEQLRGGKIGNAEAVFINRICLALGIKPPRRANPAPGDRIRTTLTPEQIARFSNAQAHDRRTRAG